MSLALLTLLSGTDYLAVLFLGGRRLISDAKTKESGGRPGNRIL